MLGIVSFLSYLKGEKNVNFFYSKHYQDSYNDYESAEFSPLCQFLMAQDVPPTLRQLKETFTEKTFVKMLDRLISKDIVRRENKRYQLNFPIFTKQDQQFAEATLQEKAEGPVAKDGLNSEWLQQVYRLQEDMRYFYACEGEIPQARIIALSHPMFQWWTITQTQWPKTVPAFFAANQRQLQIPAHQELMTLLGDVDVAYYLDQISVIFERIQKGKKVRPTIFLRSLQLAGIVSDDDPPTFLVSQNKTESTGTQWIEPTLQTLFAQRIQLALGLGESVSQDIIFFN